MTPQTIVESLLLEGTDDEREQVTKAINNFFEVEE